MQNAQSEVKMVSRQTHTKFACPREIFTILVEADGHHSVGSIERLFDSISMMTVDIDV
jgi:hypothetical protein